MHKHSASRRVFFRPRDILHVVCVRYTYLYMYLLNIHVALIQPAYENEEKNIQIDASGGQL